MTIFAVEWQGVFRRSWNFERPLVFSHVVITKTLGIHRSREIWAWISRRMDLLEGGIHKGLVGDTET